MEFILRNKLSGLISINYEIETPQYKDNGLYLAIDLGVSQTAGVNIYGKSIQFKHRRADLYWKKKISEIQSRRDHCKKFSNRWYWYNNKLKKIKIKCSKQLKDFQHYLSKKIVENTRANTIVIGDLNVKRMSKRCKGTGSAVKNKIVRTLHYSVSNTGYMSRFAEFLTYKAEKIGKRVIRVDESMTTKICCVCGKKEDRTLFERVINCDCGNDIDRDINSAINIMVKFLLNKKSYDFLSHQSSMNEESFLQKWKGFSTIHSPIVANAGDSGLVESY